MTPSLWVILIILIGAWVFPILQQNWRDRQPALPPVPTPITAFGPMPVAPVAPPKAFVRYPLPSSGDHQLVLNNREFMEALRNVSKDKVNLPALQAKDLPAEYPALVEFYDVFDEDLKRMRVTTSIVYRAGAELLLTACPVDTSVPMLHYPSP